MNTILDRYKEYVIRSWDIDTSICHEVFRDTAFGFAERLSGKIGGKIYYLSNSIDESFFHAVVKLNDEYLDPLGVWTQENLFDFWGDCQTAHSNEKADIEYFLNPSDGSVTTESNILVEHMIDNIHI